MVLEDDDEIESLEELAEIDREHLNLNEPSHSTDGSSGVYSINREYEEIFGEKSLEYETEISTEMETGTVDEREDTRILFEQENVEIVVEKDKSEI